jgi:anti-anti-sigma regulatory factor
MTANERARGPDCPLPVPQPPSGPVSVVLRIAGVVDEAGAAELCRTVRELCGDVAHLHVVDVVACDTTEAAADIGLVGALARLALTARRRGCTLRVRGGPPELARLVDLAGLADVLPVVPCPPPSGAQESSGA